MAGAGSRTRVSAGLSRASVPDTLLAGLAVFGPILAQGVILRRPAMVALAERLEADRRAGQVLARLRDRYGPGPLRLRLPAASWPWSWPRPTSDGSWPGRRSRSRSPTARSGPPSRTSSRTGCWCRPAACAPTGAA